MSEMMFNVQSKVKGDFTLVAFLGYEYSLKWFKFNFRDINNTVKDLNLSFNLCCLPFISLHTNLSRYYLTVSNLNRHLFVHDNNYRGYLTFFSTSSVSYLTDSKEDKICLFFKDKNLEPVLFYDDLYLDETRKKLKTETNGLSGIYLILNKITKDYYIGSASTGKFYARFSNHLIYLKGSKIVKNAVKKYKIQSFSFIILELFPEIVTKENNKRLLDLEDFYLKSLLPNYNILTEAGNSFGYKHTDIDRIKMKSNYSLERRQQIGNLNRGRTFSKETIEKMRAKALARTKVKFSDEALRNMKKKSKPITLYNLDLTVFGSYSSISEAAKAINCDVKTIRRALNTNKKLVKRRFIVKLS